MAWKPVGYNSVSPYLIVRNAKKTLAFTEAVFDAERLRVIPSGESDGIMHAEIRIDDTVVMLGEQLEGLESNIHVYVADAEATFARARESGGRVVQELAHKGDGDYRGGISDENGTVWWIAQQEQPVTDD